MKRTRPLAFEFFPADWLSSMTIELMTLEERGAYIQLLCLQWLDSDCGLPGDDKILARLSGLKKKWITSKVRSKFIPHPRVAGKVCNLKLLAVNDTKEAFKQKCSAAGAYGAKQRWQKKETMGYPANPIANPNGVDICKPHANPNGVDIAPYPYPLPDPKDLKDLKTYTSAEKDQLLVVDPSLQGPSPFSCVSEPKNKVPHDIAEQFQTFWNQQADGFLPAIMEMTNTRHWQIRARWKEHPSWDFWKTLIEKVKSSKFLMGKEHDWICTADWLISNEENCLKVMEGHYSDKKARDSPRETPEEREKRYMAMIADSRSQALAIERKAHKEGRKR